MKKTDYAIDRDKNIDDARDFQTEEEVESKHQNENISGADEKIDELERQEKSRIILMFQRPLDYP